MNRDEYLKILQKCSVLPKGIGHLIKDIPKEVIVLYDGVQYYPYSYKLDFDEKGNARHTAVLHSLTANAITNAKMERVTKYEQKRNI